MTTSLSATGLIIAVCLSAVAAADGALNARHALVCAPGYKPCLPETSDLDCDQIPESRRPVRVTGRDPYALDRDGDGVGCEVAGKGGGRQSPWGLILRKPPGKEAKSARVGDLLYVFGWSPASMRGKPYQLCSIGPGSYLPCDRSAGSLNGKVQRLGTWRVAPREVVYGQFTLIIRLGFKVKASDRVRIR